MVAYQLQKVFEFLPDLVSAIPLTLGVLFASLFGGSVLGAGLAWAQVAGDATVKKIAQGFIFVMRCTPPIVLIFLVFYGLPEFLNWWLAININDWSQSIFTVVAMSLLYSATLSEVFQSAYEAIPQGQTEAGLSIGLTSPQVLVRIVLPQALRVALPNVTNSILNLLKDIALAYTVGLVDIMGASNLLISRNIGNYSLETYTAAAILYWGLSLILTLLMQWWERELTPAVG